MAIANDLMDRGKFAEARPYADAAAQTWAEWAMQCAQRCAEGRQDWEAAEGYARDRAGRYPNSWSEWLVFCLRTGHGDLDAAVASTRLALDQAGDESAEGALLPSAILAQRDGDPKKAAGILRRGLDRGSRDPMVAVLLALALDSAGDARGSAAAYARAAGLAPATAPTGVKLSALFRDAMAEGRDGRLSLSAVEELIKGASDAGRGNCASIAAWFLANRGRHDDARPYWTLAAESSTTFVWLRLLAVDALKRHPAPPEPGDEDVRPAEAEKGR